MNIGKKVGFAAVFIDMTRKGTLFEEAPIHLAKITAIKITLKDTKD